MRFSIEQKLLENIINYLATKPYNEVQALIASIQQDIKPVPEPGKTQPAESEASNP